MSTNDVLQFHSRADQILYPLAFQDTGMMRARARLRVDMLITRKSSDVRAPVRRHKTGWHSGCRCITYSISPPAWEKCNT